MSSEKPDAGELVLDQLRASLDGSRYSLTAVYAAIIVAFGGAVAVSCGVLAIWHQLREVYAAKPLLVSRLSEYSGNPDTTEPQLRHCLKETWKAKEQHIVDNHGLDATIYLRALRMARNIFALLTLLLFFVAAPINVVFNLHTSLINNLTKRDALLLLTPSLLSSTQMIPHVVLGWVTNLCVLAIVWYNYRKVSNLREAYFASPEFTRKLHNRTVLLTDIPKCLRSTEGIARVLEHANPHVSPDAISITKKVDPQLTSLLDEYRTNVRELERELISRPGSNRADSLNGNISRISREIDIRRAESLSHKFGNLAETKVKGYSHTAASSESYGFASYALFKEAQTTVHRAQRHNIDSSVNLRMAPPSEQIVWNNLRLSAAERGTKQVVANILYGILVVLWIVPSAFIGCFLSNLSRLGSVWPAFGTAMQHNQVGFAILQGVLAPTITTAIFSALPFVFRRFSNMQGKVTRVDREREVLRKLYVFFFFDNYFVFTMMGVVWDVIAQVLQQTQAAGRAHQSLTFHEVWSSLRVASRIATAIVNISSFWVMYLLRAIFALFGSSAQPITLCKRLGQRLNFIKRPTPREQAENDMPQPFQYATGYLSVLFNATVALGFTTIQPLVLPIALILFVLAVPLKKYEIMHMQYTKYESNGMFWPLVCDIVMFALAFGNLMLLCVVWVQAGWKIAIAACPLAATVAAFKIYVVIKFEGRFYYPDSIELPYDLKAQDADDQPQLSELYADPSSSSELEKPLLSYRDALHHYATLYFGDDKTSTETSTGVSTKSTKLETENPFGYRHVSIGAVRVRGSPYSPVEPYPAYQHYDKHTGNDLYYAESPSLYEEPVRPMRSEENSDYIPSVDLQDQDPLDPFTEHFSQLDPGEYLLKH